jgi:ribonuclease VapC
MFLDASAIVAIVVPEPDGRALSQALERDPDPITSPIAVFEAVTAVRRLKGTSIATALADVRSFLDVTGTRIVPITPDDGEQALQAYARYGKGQGHPAQLNMGDCFAYAMARSHDTALLYKGDDFARTDIPRGHGAH